MSLVRLKAEFHISLEDGAFVRLLVGLKEIQGIPLVGYSQVYNAAQALSATFPDPYCMRVQSSFPYGGTSHFGDIAIHNSLLFLFSSVISSEAGPLTPGSLAGLLAPKKQYISIAALSSEPNIEPHEFEKTVARVADQMRQAGLLPETSTATFELSDSRDEDVESLIRDRIEKAFTGSRFTPAQITAQEAAISSLLRSKELRLVLTSLRKARSIDEETFKKSLTAAGLTKDADALISEGLLQLEILYQCRKTSARLATAPVDQSSSEAILPLRCAECGRLYSEELRVRHVSPSPLLQGLLDGSKWMTVAVTETLIKCGIPLNRIAWNIEGGGEEIDVVCLVGDSLWILELKDREFGGGDAHPFNYRRSLLKPESAFVVSTEAVSPDAKAIFSKMDQGPFILFTGPNSLPEPTLVEGLDQLEGVVSTKLAKVEHDYIEDRVRRVLRSTEFPLLNMALDALLRAGRADVRS